MSRDTATSPSSPAPLPRSCGDALARLAEVIESRKPANGGDPRRIVGEVADLWFHSMIALAHYGLTPADVIAELERRAGTSGIEEKALRKAKQREGQGNG